MKKKLFIVLFTVQCVLNGFSQTDSAIHQYTDAQVAKLTSYISELEGKYTETNSDEEKKEMSELMSRPEHKFTDNELIKITNYIKKLEGRNTIASYDSNHQIQEQPYDSLLSYSDAEINKFTNYISDLENRIYANDSSYKPTAEKQNVIALLSKPVHKYTDQEIIRLANYIKSLERADSTAIVFAKNQSDTLALVKVIPKDSTLILNTEIEKYSRLVFFNFNSSSLKEESYKPLNEVVTILKSNKSLIFVVEGHTDNVGTSEYNMALSKRRVSTVKRHLISKGIASARVTSKGFGEEAPIDTNDTDEGRAKNRRVEIKVKN
ncbi:MAG: OmpA family protein [Bacteroidota bacterium]